MIKILNLQLSIVVYFEMKFFLDTLELFIRHTRLSLMHPNAYLVTRKTGLQHGQIGFTAGGRESSSDIMLLSLRICNSEDLDIGVVVG